jgi:hypothetical protein
MTVEFALDFIPRRMRELGYGENYITRWRHLQIEPSQTLKLEGSNEYFLLINPGSNFAVRSKTGVFDLADAGVNEQQYEHRGKTQIKNRAETTQLILFIQVIPNHI